MMAGSCGRQSHTDGESCAHVHHFADHGQSGRFLQFINRTQLFPPFHLETRLDVETQKPTDKKQKIKIKGKPIKFSPKCFCFFFFFSFKSLRRHDGWLLRAAQEICWVKTG
jgi:hypothetical protein